MLVTVKVVVMMMVMIIIGINLTEPKFITLTIISQRFLYSPERYGERGGKSRVA